VDRLALHVGHVAERGEDDEAGEDARESVDGARQNGVPVDVVAVLVVGAERDDRAEARSEREENLSCCVDPDLYIKLFFLKFFNSI